MVTMINYVPLDLNDFDPRRDDAEVTVTVGSLGGFEVLLRRSGPAAWRRVMTRPSSRRPGRGRGPGWTA